MEIECIKKEHVSYSTECNIKKFCCRKMKKVFDENWKSSYNDGSGSWYNTFKIDSCGIEIPVRIAGCGYYITHREYINYCPFCGEIIE